MKISELVNAPQWLIDADTENADVAIIDGIVQWYSGEFRGGNFRGGDFLGGNFRGGNFLGGNFLGGNFRGGDFRGGEFRGGNFRGGNFWGGNFRGGNFRGGNVRGLAAEKLRAYVGLYPYQVSSFLTTDGKRYVQMGCLLKTLEEWEQIGIRNSNPSEFPDDGSEKCEERVAAFEFARAAALRMKIPAKKEETC